MYHFTTDWFTPNVPQFQRFLEPLAGKPCRLLEIGTFEGRSTVWLLENIATHPRARIDTMDPWEQPQLRSNLRAAGGAEKVTFHRGPSSIMLRRLGGGYDFAYVDGSHQAADVLADAVHAFQMVKIGGVIGFDDYDWSHPVHGTPKPGLDAFLSVFDGKVEVLVVGHQLWCRKIAGDTIPQRNDVELRMRFKQLRRLWRGRLKQAFARQI